MRPSNRRQFIKMGTLGLGSLYASRHFPALLGDTGEDPHFFVQLFFAGGMDVSYTFDARPLSMTADNLQHNVLGEEQLLFRGRNGGQCLRSPLTKILDPYLQDFSVINGIHMTQLDGHEQNAAYLMTGSPFGGDAFLPFMNLQAGDPLDFVRLGKGNFLIPMNNAGNSVHLAPEASLLLSQHIEKLGRISVRRDPLMQSILTSDRVRGEDKDGFGVSAGLMGEGLRGAPAAANAFSDFWEKGRNVNPKDPDAEVLYASTLMSSLFAKRITRSVVFAFDSDLNQDFMLDVHDRASAAKMPQTIKTIFGKVAKILETFKQIPFDKQRSFYDVTTFMVSSEFGRTRRQMFWNEGDQVNDKGTDHNPYLNTVLLGGKGIKPGLVVGGSDLQSSDEIINKRVSKAHLALDPELIHIMGKPFDFKTFQTIDLPDTPYSIKDYLSMASVVNTVLKATGVPKEKYFAPERNADPAPVLDLLIKS